MPTATLEANHDLRCQLAAEAVESNTGVIRGATVAKAGVQAAGKFVFLDAKGQITRDEKLARKRIPVFTDAKTLDTLMAAAKAVGKRIKMREDHVDTVGARAGYADTIRRVTDAGRDRVVADLHLFKTYRNRDVVLETAAETPEEIGLSIDFIPDFEIVGERALIRVLELEAVDIVDKGAITPDGLLLSARVDTGTKVEPDEISKPDDTMAASPSNEEIMTALSALTKTVGDCMAAVSKLAAPTEEKKTDGAALKATNEAVEKLSATVKEQNDKLASVIADNAKMKREKALLGFRGTSEERAKLATAPVEEIEKLTSEKKDYLKLVADRVASEKCKKSEAHVWAMKHHKEEYAAHLAANGVVKIAA